MLTLLALIGGGLAVFLLGLIGGLAAGYAIAEIDPKIPPPTKEVPLATWRPTEPWEVGSHGVQHWGQREHNTASPDCWCDPKIEDGVIIHNKLH